MLGLGPAPPDLGSLKLFVIRSFEIHCQALQTVGLIASHWTSFWIQFLLILRGAQKTNGARLRTGSGGCKHTVSCYASSTVNGGGDATLTGRGFPAVPLERHKLDLSFIIIIIHMSSEVGWFLLHWLTTNFLPFM